MVGSLLFPIGPDRLDEAIAEYMVRLDRGENLDRAAFLEAHPDVAKGLAEYFAEVDALDGTLSRSHSHPSLPGGGADESCPREFGDYTLLEFLARGGMGEVFKARHRSLDRIVALKMILAGRSASRSDVARFRRETEAIARLDHPNIVPIYEVGTEDGRHFFTMKYLPGGTLAKRLRGGLEPVAAARLLGTLARAVHAGHRRGILHRDLKPANILLDDRGEPHVADFGLAKLASDSDDGSLTRTGTVVGTPAYMSPEQLAGEPVTTAADIYALGTILYELLTDDVPFPGATPLDLLRKKNDREPAPLPARVGRDLAAVCTRCLERDPSRRYASAAELADDLERWLRGESTAARPATSPERIARWMRRHPTRAALFGVSLLALLASGATVVGLIYNSRLQEANGNLNDALGDARTARAEESLQRARAEGSLSYADHLGYILRITQADAQLRERHVDAARRLLSECPVERRGWEWRYLWNQCRHNRVVIRGHTPYANQAEFSADGTFVATAGQDGTIKGWNAATGQELFCLAVGAPVRGIAFSPYAEHLAAACEDGVIRIWSLSGQKPSADFREFKGHTKPVDRVLFSSTAKLLASASEDGTVRMWNVGTGREEFAAVKLPSPARRLAFDRTRQCFAAACGGDNSTKCAVHILDARTGTLVRSIAGQGRHAGVEVAYDTHGSKMVTAIDGERVHTRSADGVIERILPGRNVTAMGMSQAGAYGWKVGIGRGDGDLAVYDSIDGEHLATWYRHAGAILSVAFNPGDGRIVMTSGADGAVVIGDAVVGKIPLILASGHGASDFAFRPDGRELAFTRFKAPTTFVDLQTAAKRNDVIAKPLNRLAYSPDGETLAAIGADASLQLWPRSAREARITQAQTTHSTALAFHPDGKLFADVFEGEIQLRDADTAMSLGVLRNGVSKISAVAFHPDRRHLASADAGGTVKLWDLKTREATKSISVPGSGITGLSFAPDGSILIASGDRVMRLWNPATTDPPREFGGDHNFYRAAAVHPNGKCFAAARTDKTVSIWDLSTGREMLTMVTGEYRPIRMTFDPTGRWLAAIDDGGYIRVWDAPPNTEP